MPNTKQITTINPSVHQANNKQSLNNILAIVESGDTIVITQSGDYGTIYLRSLNAIRIKARSNHLHIQAKISIEDSSKLIIENINFWHSHKDNQPIIFINQQSDNIVIRYCLFSSLKVKINEQQKNYLGSPAHWINSIIVKGSHCEIFNNTFTNVRTAIRSDANDTNIKNNIIQYFSKNAIQLSGNNTQLIDNHIYSPLNKSTKQQTAIKLISSNGTLDNIKIHSNIINNRHNNLLIPTNLQSQLAAITALDGYFTKVEIISNTITINSEHAISINGAAALTLNNNSISGRSDQANTGIRIYLSRKKIEDNYQWINTHKYSISYRNNHAPYFNVAKEYTQQDLGDNHFNREESNSSYDHTSPIISSPTIQTTDTSRQTVHTVENADQLNIAIHNAQPNDSIILNKHGNYGSIQITNKQKLRISSISKQLPIQMNIIISNECSDITLDNIQIWNDELSHRYLIIAGKDCKNIIINNCILSTHPLIPDTMHQHFRGYPDQWISGIRMLGSDCHIKNNALLNLKSAILETGPNNQVDSNIIRFYSEDAIRVSNHGVHIIRNQVLDSISAANDNQAAHKDAIQLIPPKDRFEGGALHDVKIIDNIIQSQTESLLIPNENKGIVQGIFASDGYFVNTHIENNTIKVNSDHGISINGVHKMHCKNNEIVNLDRTNQFTPGIKFYLTRISIEGQQRWLLNKEYSVSIESNLAPVLNIPDQSYQTTDLGNNEFKDVTHTKGRGNHLLFDNDTQATDKTTNQVFNIHDNAELQAALQTIKDGDQLIFEESGFYGEIKLRNQQNITIKGRHRDILINANIVLDGHCKNITISNLSLWFSKKDWHPVILIGLDTEQITIQNCFISSTQTIRQDARQNYTGNTKEWVVGIWSRGINCNIINTYIANVRSGIILNGESHTLQNNLIQYFIDAGIRIMSDNNTLLHNNIYDAIESDPNTPHLATGIQLIPYQNRFEGGLISNLKLTHNIIQQKSAGSITEKESQSKLQGISLHDGHLINAEITNNTIVIDTEHGIIINGAEFIELHGNHIHDSNPHEGHTPGIRFYLTRTIDIKNNRRRVWHTSLNYSIRYSNNQAAIFNIPSSSYLTDNLGNNTFRVISHDRARGINPIIEH